MHRVEFEVKHEYSDTGSGIIIPVALGFSATWVRLPAKLDTGAEFCLFAREYASMLGIDVESGERQQIRTVNSTFVAFGHMVSLRFLDLNFYLMAYFYQDDSIKRNVLGRREWMIQTRLGIVDHDRILYMSHYND